MYDPEICDEDFDPEDIQTAIEEAAAGKTYSEEEFFSLLREDES